MFTLPKMRPCVGVCAALACLATSVSAWAQGDATHRVPFFPSASDDVRQGFVRVVNRSGHSGEVSVVAVDDAGTAHGPLTLALDGRRTVHFNSDDLEHGNPGKGLAGSTGGGNGDWRLELTSDLDLEVLAYVRTVDGFLTAMHDVAPVSEGRHRVATFNPGSNVNQVSRLRLINPGAEAAEVTITGTDDRGQSPGSPVRTTVPAGAARTFTAQELEAGGAGLTGALGDGAVKWRLEVVSDQPIRVQSLLLSPTGHLTNLSTAPSNMADGAHQVLVFPSDSDASGRQGFVRVINRSAGTAEIAVRARDDTERDHGALTLTVPGGQVAQFNSEDLEKGNASKGLSGGTGPGMGDWRLELSGGPDIDVLAYIRTADGFLTAMHDVAPAFRGRHRVATFNPGININQVSRLRIVNLGAEAAEVTITGTDDRGRSPGSPVRATVPAGAARTYTAQELESGGRDFEGALGDGAGKWRLDVASDQPARVLSLLSSPTGHLTNLSTVTARDDGERRAEEAFRDGVSAIVQSKCVNCHVAGGDSGNTRLVFVPDSDPGHLATNYQAFATFVDTVDGGADLILDKIRGIDHGGGVQVPEDSEEYATMERFLERLAGEKVSLRVRTFGEGTVEIVDGGELACDGRACSSLIRTGSRVTLRATAAQGYTFDGWRSCDRVAGNDCVVTVDSERLVFADFLSTEPLAFEDDVVVFDRARLADVEEYDPDSGLMILGPDAKLDDIEIGSVLVSSVITDDLGFESYFLRRVTDLRHAAGSPAFLRTTHATLDDLIRSGSLSSSLPLGPEQVTAYELPAGVTPLSHRGAAMTVTELPNGRKLFKVGKPKTIRPLAAPVSATSKDASGDLSFDVKLEQGGVTVTGEFTITVTHDFKLSWSFRPWSFGPKELQAKVNVTPHAKKLTASVSISKEFTPVDIEVAFGAVAFGPVVIVPTVSGQLVLDFETKAATFSPTLDLRLDIEAGATYLRGEGWTGIWGVTRKVKFDPSHTVKLGMEATAGPVIKLATKVYGLAGPFVDAGPYVRGEIISSLNEDCAWNYAVHYGAKSDFGVEVDVYGFGIEATMELYKAEFPLPDIGRNCPEGAKPKSPPKGFAVEPDGWAIDVSWDPWTYGGSLPVSYEVNYSNQWFNGVREFYQSFDRELADTSFRLDRTTPDRNYCFRVRALIAGDESEWTERKCVFMPKDNDPPTAPGNAVATALSSSTIELTWTAARDNDERGVYHSVLHLDSDDSDDSDDNVLRVESVYRLSHEIPNLIPGRTYCYRVRAEDLAGNISNNSNRACVTTPNEPNWRFQAACTGQDYQIKQHFHLDEESGDEVFAFKEDKDYDGVASNHALTGSYDKATRLLDGKVVWTFDDTLGGVRTDTFKADLSSDDTGDIVTEKDGPAAGCDLVVRFNRLDGSEASASSPKARPLSTAPPRGQETIRRRP